MTIERMTAPAASPASPTRDERPTPPANRRRLTVRRLIAFVVVLLVLLTGGSYVRALTYPGSAPFQVRSVEWVRDHGGNGLVDRIENWYYSSHAPRGSAPDPAALPAAPAAGVRAAVRAPAALPLLAGHTPVRAEGAWVAGRRDPAGLPAIYTTFVRPDPAHPSVVAGVAWIRAGDTRAHLVPGTVEPAGARWPSAARVATADVPALVATFNSGWKMAGARGGFYLAGRTARPLRVGAASVVIDDAGRATVGQWGRDVSMTSHVVAVRQNLALIVDGGRPVPGLASNKGAQWGNARNQYQYTWRSGIGTDRAGDLVYVGGPELTLRALATALADVGAVRGMELDIHPSTVSFASWAPAPTGRVVPTNLLPTFDRPADRYLAPDQRDFFYLTLR